MGRVGMAIMSFPMSVRLWNIRIVAEICRILGSILMRLNLEIVLIFWGIYFFCVGLEILSTIPNGPANWKRPMSGQEWVLHEESNSKAEEYWCRAIKVQSEAWVRFQELCLYRNSTTTSQKDLCWSAMTTGRHGDKGRNGRPVKAATSMSWYKLTMELLLAIPGPCR